MPSEFDRRLAVVWLVLVGIALLYVVVDDSVTGALRASVPVTVIAICLAMIKVRIVMREFMEVRTSPRLLRRITDMLIVVMTAALIASFTVGRLVG